VIPEHWKHGAVDAECPVATFDTRAAAEAYARSAEARAAARQAAGPPGGGTEHVTLAVQERPTP